MKRLLIVTIFPVVIFLTGCERGVDLAQNSVNQGSENQELKNKLEEQQSEIDELKKRNEEEKQRKIQEEEERKRQEEEQANLAQLKVENDKKTNCLERKKRYEERLADLKKTRDKKKKVGKEFEEIAEETYEYDKKNLNKSYIDVLEGECLKYL